MGSNSSPWDDTSRSTFIKLIPIQLNAHRWMIGFTNTPVFDPTLSCSFNRISTKSLHFANNGPESAIRRCSPGFMMEVYNLQFGPCALIMLSPTSEAITLHGIFFWLPAFAYTSSCRNMSTRNCGRVASTFQRPANQIFTAPLRSSGSRSHRS